MSPDNTLNNAYKILIDREQLETIIQKNLPQHLRKVFDRKLGYFSENLFHPSLNTKKYNAGKNVLRNLGVDEIWEFYINRRDHRCVFYVMHETKRIIIAYVGNHQTVERRYG